MIRESIILNIEHISQNQKFRLVFFIQNCSAKSKIRDL